MIIDLFSTGFQPVFDRLFLYFSTTYPLRSKMKRVYRKLVGEVGNMGCWWGVCKIYSAYTPFSTGFSTGHYFGGGQHNE